MIDGRTVKVGALYAVGIVGALGLELGLLGPAIRLGPPAQVALLIAVTAWGLWFAGMAWRRTDEAAREAHKFAAFWGMPFALLTLILALPAVAIIGFHVRLHPGAQLFTAPREHWGLIMAGVILAALVQVVGYALAWAGWWLKHR